MDPLLTAKVGTPFANKLTVCVLAHPFPSLPVTVYVPGIVTVLVDVLGPLVQVYVDAPLAVKVDGLPAQITVGLAATEIVGSAYTFKLKV